MTTSDLTNLKKNVAPFEKTSTKVEYSTDAEHLDTTCRILDRSILKLVCIVLACDSVYYSCLWIS